MKVLLHLRTRGIDKLENQTLDFDRVPVENEYITLSSEDEQYKVEVVLHTPSSEETCAEVYAVKSDIEKELRKKSYLPSRARVSSSNAW